MDGVYNKKQIKEKMHRKLECDKTFNYGQQLNYVPYRQLQTNENSQSKSTLRSKRSSVSHKIPNYNDHQNVSSNSNSKSRNKNDKIVEHITSNPLNHAQNQIQVNMNMANEGTPSLSSNTIVNNKISLSNDHEKQRLHFQNSGKLEDANEKYASIQVQIHASAEIDNQQNNKKCQTLSQTTQQFQQHRNQQNEDGNHQLNPVNSDLSRQQQNKQEKLKEDKLYFQMQLQTEVKQLQRENWNEEQSQNQRQLPNQSQDLLFEGINQLCSKSLKNDNVGHLYNPIIQTHNEQLQNQVGLINNQDLQQQEQLSNQQDIDEPVSNIQEINYYNQGQNQSKQAQIQCQGQPDGITEQHKQSQPKKIGTIHNSKKLSGFYGLPSKKGAFSHRKTSNKKLIQSIINQQKIDQQQKLKKAQKQKQSQRQRQLIKETQKQQQIYQQKQKANRQQSRSNHKRKQINRQSKQRKLLQEHSSSCLLGQKKKESGSTIVEIKREKKREQIDKIREAINSKKATTFNNRLKNNKNVFKQPNQSKGSNKGSNSNSNSKLNIVEVINCNQISFSNLNSHSTSSSNFNCPTITSPHNDGSQLKNRNSNGTKSKVQENRGSKLLMRFKKK